MIAQSADSMIANTFLNVYRATVDADASLRFIQEKTGKGYVALVGCAKRTAGLWYSRTRDRRDVRYEEVQQVTGDGQRSLGLREFVLVFQDRIHRGRSFYVGSEIAPHIAIYTFLPIRGPLEKVPGVVSALEDELQVCRD